MRRGYKNYLKGSWRLSKFIADTMLYTKYKVQTTMEVEVSSSPQMRGNHIHLFPLKLQNYKTAIRRLQSISVFSSSFSRLLASCGFPSTASSSSLSCSSPPSQHLAHHASKSSPHWLADRATSSINSKVRSVMLDASQPSPTGIYGRATIPLSPPSAVWCSA